MKKNIYGLLFIILNFLAYLFISKSIYIAPHLEISAGLIIYSFTYLLLLIFYKNNKLKDTKKVIYYSFIMLFVIYFIISIFNTINPVVETNEISNSLRNIFTPNYFNIFKITIYYPNLITFLTYNVIFFLFHYIFILVYDALNNYTNDYISFILAYLISMIIDQVLYITLINIPNLMYNDFKYNELIERITASFIIVILMSIILTVIYYLINRISKKNR